MTLQGALARTFLGRNALYLLFGALALIPVAAFAVGPLSGDSFDLQGPGGPLLAFSAGVLSFVSPCVLPLVPIYITHLSGASIEAGRVKVDRRVTFTHAIAFVGGLSIVFVLLGTSVGLLGSYFFRDNQRDLEQVAGVMLLLMGIILIPAHGARSPLRSALVLFALTAVYFALAEIADLRGDRARLLVLGGVLAVAWLRFSGYLPLPWLQRTYEVPVGRQRTVGYGRSALVGGAFALGWTPCIGPILGSILTLAATSSHALTGLYLLISYSAGFSVPFLIAGLAVGDVSRVIRRIQPYAPFIEVASGVMLLGVGVLLLYGRISGLNTYFDFAAFNGGL